MIQRTRKLNVKDWHIICGCTHEARSWDDMLILAVQRAGEVEIWEFSRAGCGPVRIIDTDCVRNGLPIRVDGVVVDSDRWTTCVEEDIWLRVCRTCDSEFEVMHLPKGRSRIIDGQRFQSRAVCWVDGAEAKGTSSTT